MTAPDVFEYALVRVVPRVERGEAISEVATRKEVAA